MELWNKLKAPPAYALREIKAGRLRGMTDINPQWRYQALTEALGMCGVGWKYEISKLWTEPGADGAVMAFATVNLFIKNGDGWSDPIPGVGGSALVAKERSGLYSSDEGFKMAVTDALSVAMKMVGVAADIYSGRWDGSKYKETPSNTPITDKQASEISKLIVSTKSDMKKFCEYMGVGNIKSIPANQYDRAISALKAKATKGNGNDN